MLLKLLATMGVLAALSCAPIATSQPKMPPIELTKEAVMEQLDHLNYCEKSGDCANVGSRCPFGCATVVNAVEADEAKSLMKSYFEHSKGPRCEYMCLPIRSIECVESKCKATFGGLPEFGSFLEPAHNLGNN